MQFLMKYPSAYPYPQPLMNIPTQPFSDDPTTKARNPCIDCTSIRNCNNLIKVPITETSKVAPLPSTTILSSFLLLNACHVSNIIHELSAVVAINKPTLVLVTESWLSEAIPDSAITIGPKFKNFRLDRATAGDAVLAYVHSSIPVTRLVTAEVSNKKLVWLALENTSKTL